MDLNNLNNNSCDLKMSLSLYFYLNGKRHIFVCSEQEDGLVGSEGGLLMRGWKEASFFQILSVMTEGRR